MAPNGGTTAPTIGQDIVAGLGLGILLTVTLVVVYYYGHAGETSAAGVLGLVFTAIGSIVGTVFGVGVGTATGQAGGRQIAADAKERAKTVLSQHVTTLNQALKKHSAALDKLRKAAPQGMVSDADFDDLEQAIRGAIADTESAQRYI